MERLAKVTHTKGLIAKQKPALRRLLSAGFCKKIWATQRGAIHCIYTYLGPSMRARAVGKVNRKPN